MAVFHWGVAGVAWATFLAQGIACVLALITLKKRLASIHTEEKAEVFSWNMLGKISRIAVPSILQQLYIHRQHFYPGFDQFLWFFRYRRLFGGS